MSVLPLLTAPDPLLERVSAPVGAVDDGVRRLMGDLVETMRVEAGIGLAAPQAGVARRVFVCDVPEEDGGPGRVLCLADPEVVEASDETAEHREGCLSVPGLWAEVERPARVRVRYLDEEGAAREVAAEGLFAACLQHEIDHLDGVLFYDRLGAVRRDLIVRRLRRRRRLGLAEDGGPSVARPAPGDGGGADSDSEGDAPGSPGDPDSDSEGGDPPPPAAPSL